MIYAVQILDGMFIKIGYSGDKDVSKRIASLQTGCPFEITQMLVVEGTLRQEKAIHLALSEALRRIRLPTPPNEWYRGNHPFFKEFMASLAVSPNFALAFADKYSVNVKQPSKKRRKGPSNRADFTNVKWPILNKEVA